MGVDKIMTKFSIFGCTCPLMFTTVLLLLSAILFPQMNSKHQCNHLKHLLMQCVLLKKNQHIRQGILRYQKLDGTVYIYISVELHSKRHRNFTLVLLE